VNGAISLGILLVAGVVYYVGARRKRPALPQVAGGVFAVPTSVRLVSGAPTAASGSDEQVSGVSAGSGVN
jgi:hypothetical protein